MSWPHSHYMLARSHTHQVWDLRTNSVQQSVERAHASRVRGLAAVSAGSGALPELLASASSDGVVKLWDARAMSSPSSASRKDPTCIAQATTRARITCLTVCNPKAPGSVQVPSPAPKPKASEEVAGQVKKQQAAQSKQGKQGGKQQPQQQRQQRGKAQKEDYGFEIVKQDDEDVAVPAPQPAAPKPVAAKQKGAAPQQQQAGKKQGPGSNSGPQQPNGKKLKPATVSAPQAQPGKQQAKPKQSAPQQAGGATKQKGSKPGPQGGQKKPGMAVAVQKGGVQKKVGVPRSAQAGGSAGGKPKKKFAMKLPKA